MLPTEEKGCSNFPFSPLSESSTSSTTRSTDLDIFKDTPVPTSDGCTEKTPNKSPIFEASKHTRQHSISRTLSFHSDNLASVPYPKSSGVEHVMINVVFYTKSLPSMEAVYQLATEKMLKFLRFRSVPVAAWWGWATRWKEVEVNLKDHVHLHHVENDEAAHAELESVIRIGYPQGKPRWEIRLIQNAQTSNPSYYPNARNMIVIRVDHCISDGMSLVKTCKNFLTTTNGEMLSEETELGLIRTRPYLKSLRLPSKAESCNHSQFPQWFCRLISFFYFLATCSTIFGEFVSFLLRFIHGIFQTFYEIWGPYDSNTPLTPPKEKKKMYGVQKPTAAKIVKGQAISLQYVKKLKDKLEVPLNDVIITAFAGALRRFCDTAESKSSTSNKKGNFINVRAVVPYAFISAPSVYKDEVEALRNRWVAVSVDLDMNEKDPLKRLQNMHNITQSLKNRLQPLTNYYVHSFFGQFMSRKFIKKCGGEMFNKHTVIFANVPSLPVPFCFAGVLVQEIYVFLESVLPIVEIISYNNQMFFSFVADSEVVSDMELLPEYFVNELCKMGYLAGITNCEFEIHNSSS